MIYIYIYACIVHNSCIDTFRYVQFDAQYANFGDVLMQRYAMRKVPCY